MGLISHEGIGTCTGIQDGGAAFFNSFLVRSLLWEGKIVKKSFENLTLPSPNRGGGLVISAIHRYSFLVIIMT